MKKQYILILSFIVILFNQNVLAQLKINSNGELRLTLPNEGAWGNTMITKIYNNYAKCYVVENSSGQHNFYVRGDGFIIARGTFVNSDRNFKTNIVNIDSSRIHQLYKLNAKTYNYKTENLSHQQNLLNENLAEKQFGFIAQDVKPIFPELVTTDENGLLSVNYAAFVPLLTEALKELRQENKKQQQEINKLKQKLKGFNNKNTKKPESNTEANNSTKRTTSTSAGTNQLKKAEKSSSLQQNVPNPFNESTEIRFTVANQATSAKLYVFNLQGNLLKEYDIPEKGSGSIQIHGSELSAGMYVYSLVVDNKIVDTKRMILTKN